MFIDRDPKAPHAKQFFDWETRAGTDRFDGSHTIFFSRLGKVLEQAPKKQAPTPADEALATAMKEMVDHLDEAKVTDGTLQCFRLQLHLPLLRMQETRSDACDEILDPSQPKVYDESQRLVDAEAVDLGPQHDGGTVYSDGSLKLLGITYRRDTDMDAVLRDTQLRVTFRSPEAESTETTQTTQTTETTIEVGYDEQGRPSVTVSATVKLDNKETTKTDSWEPDASTTRALLCLHEWTNVDAREALKKANAAQSYIHGFFPPLVRCVCDGSSDEKSKQRASERLWDSLVARQFGLKLRYDSRAKSWLSWNDPELWHNLDADELTRDLCCAVEDLYAQIGKVLDIRKCLHKRYPDWTPEQLDERDPFRRVMQRVARMESDEETQDGPSGGGALPEQPEESTRPPWVPPPDINKTLRSAVTNRPFANTLKSVETQS